jgi:hypothetical protein
MCKMSPGFAALLVAGLSGGACGGHYGLKSGQDGTIAEGGAAGGHAGSSVSSVIVGGSSGSMAGGTGGVASGTGGTVECPLRPCFVLAACADGTMPNADPCGCPVCPPNLDIGVAKDAGRADAQAGQFSACPMLESMLESLNPTDAARVSWAPGRFSLECALANGSTENCLSNDATTCGGSVLGCTDQCTADEYGWSVGGIGPGVAAPPPPAGCRTVPPGPGGPGFTCCPCGEASGRDAASPSEAGTSLCPPVAVEGGACPSPNLRCPGVGNPPFLCSNAGTCVCGADGIWVFFPSSCD